MIRAAITLGLPEIPVCQPVSTLFTKAECLQRPTVFRVTLLRCKKNIDCTIMFDILIKIVATLMKKVYFKFIFMSILKESSSIFLSISMY